MVQTPTILVQHLYPKTLHYITIQNSHTPLYAMCQKPNCITILIRSLMFDWSSFFFTLCICSPTKGSMHPIVKIGQNFFYKDGLQFKVIDLLAPLSKRKNWYCGAQMVRPSRAFWWWMGNWFHQPFSFFFWEAFISHLGPSQSDRKKKRRGLFYIYLDSTFLYL